jgi:cell division septation protein DedD
MADDGFHEIQLNGKQLVFLFMATTVVAVVIFLSGVMVGRGVRSERGAFVASEATSTPAPAVPEAVAAPSTAFQAAAPAAAPGAAPPAPAPATDELSYYNKLQADAAPPESLNPPAEEPAAAAPAAGEKPGPGRQAAKTRTGAEAAAKAAPAPDATEGEPPGPGLKLQVAAFKDRAEADALAARLKAKGYPAYVASPAPGSAVQMFRVRVGKFKTRRERDDVGRRLEKEEQFKPLPVR